jgi:hypothetical protein
VAAVDGGAAVGGRAAGGGRGAARAAAPAIAFPSSAPPRATASRIISAVAGLAESASAELRFMLRAGATCVPARDHARVPSERASTAPGCDGPPTCARPRGTPAGAGALEAVARFFLVRLAGIFLRRSESAPTLPAYSDGWRDKALTVPFGRPALRLPLTTSSAVMGGTRMPSRTANPSVGLHTLS